MYPATRNGMLMLSLHILAYQLSELRKNHPCCERGEQKSRWFYSLPMYSDDESSRAEGWFVLYDLDSLLFVSLGNKLERHGWKVFISRRCRI